MDEEHIADQVVEQEGQNEEITTSVDALLELLKHEEKISLEDASSKLGVTLDVVQLWVDFLVEEQIVGIEYKFTKPFIYLNRPKTPEKEAEQEQKEERITLEVIKREFIEKAQAKNIPLQNINYLWGNHVQQALNRKKAFFFNEAAKRRISNPEGLWNKYNERITVMM